MNKQDWTYKKLGEVGTFQRGKGIKRADFVETGMPCIHYGQIHTSFGVSTNRHLSSIPSELFEQSIKASHGDVIIALTSEDVEGSCKATAWLGNYDIAISSDAAIFRHNLNSIYVSYYLRSKSFFVEKSKYARGFKVTHIKTSEIAEIGIPVPPIGEQERIVAELDLLQGIIEKKKEQLKAYDQLAQSIFYTMFGDPIDNPKGWEKKDLKTICSKITDGTHDTPERLNSGVKFITGKHIRPFFIDFDNSDYVTEEVHKEIFLRCNPELGDVLYTNIGAGIGNAALNTVEYEFSMKNVALIKPKKSVVNGYFIEYYLNDEDIKSIIIDNYSNGGAQKFLSLKSIAKIPIFVPPLSLQEEFAEKVEAIERQKALVQQSIEETQTMFDYTMDKYFG